VTVLQYLHLNCSSLGSLSFEEIKQTRPKVTTPTGLFNNPFKKKLLTNFINATTTDELSQ